MHIYTDDPALRVNIDVETKSTCDLRKTSAYIYANDPTTDIILVRYCVEANPDNVGEWRCYKEPMPADLRGYLRSPDFTLVAHNAGFEKAILTAAHLVEKYQIPYIAPDRWDDTAARAARMAMPRSLDQAGQALKLPITKDIEGSRIMMQLCKPRAWTENDEPVWWEPEEFPEKYDRLSAYCAVDVRVGEMLSRTTKPLTPMERAAWLLTEEINDYGVLIDHKFAETAARVATVYLRLLDSQMVLVTEGKVQGAKKVQQLKDWCASKGFLVMDAVDDEKIVLDKGAIALLLARDDLPEDVRTALEIRRSAAKASVSKYEAMVNRVDKLDGRVRGTLVYHGATTGRWSASGIQTQNFVRDTIKNWDEVATDVYMLDAGAMDFEEFEAKHGNVMDVLSKMLRGTIMAPLDHELVFPDFSAVEARGVAWVAGAEELLALFASGGKVYEEFAAKIYDKPVESITKDSIERFLAKTAILGAGYGMGGAKFCDTCEKQGKAVELDDGKKVIDAYRTVNFKIPQLWRGLENAAINAVKNEGVEHHYQGGPDAPRITYLRKGNFLLCKLPSGRVLYYPYPRIELVASAYGPRETLAYWTVNAVTKKWNKETTWGGRLTENVVQGLCRDLMLEALLRFRDAGYRVIGTVHDEGVLEVPDMRIAAGGLDHIKSLMTVTPKWAKGFPIGADVGHGKRYGK
ncbi:DNA polymerase A [Sinorhizobium phage phiM5]|nr:DNA polymerase A [Sinorhizobium phage phiM5]